MKEESTTITHEDAGADQRRILITGRMDLLAIKVLAPLLADLIATPRKQVIVDLTGVELLSSIGLRALIESAKVVRNRGGKMVLVIDQHSIVGFTLQSTGTDQVIPTFKTLAEAQKAVVA